jgi:hypothetical protein
MESGKKHILKEFLRIIAKELKSEDEREIFEEQMKECDDEYWKLLNEDLDFNISECMKSIADWKLTNVS